MALVQLLMAVGQAGQGLGLQASTDPSVKQDACNLRGFSPLLQYTCNCSSAEILQNACSE